MRTSKTKTTIKKAKTLARAVTRPATRTKRPLTLASKLRTAMAYPISPRAMGFAGAVAAGLAASVAVVLARRPLARLGGAGLKEALSMSRPVGKSIRRAGKSVGEELDLSRLMSRLGLQRRSLFSRAWPGLAIMAGLVAAGGTTALLLQASRRVQAKTAPAPVEPLSYSTPTNGVVESATSTDTPHSFSETSHVHS